jgi:nitrate reductase gamma subunit
VLIPARIILSLSVVWAAAALIAQVIAARGGGRKDYSQRSGDPRRGMVYNFTAAMMPSHKETVKLHVLEFAAGVVMHVGVIVAIVALASAILSPPVAWRALALAWPINAIALLAGVGLLLRRTGSSRLRVLSVPDDYLAILATCGLLAMSLLPFKESYQQVLFLIYGCVLFFYMPLGKLRHALFFFVVRGEYGRRLGYRGVFPPAATRTE